MPSLSLISSSLRPPPRQPPPPPKPHARAPFGAGVVAGVGWHARARALSPYLSPPTAARAATQSPLAGAGAAAPEKLFGGAPWAGGACVLGPFRFIGRQGAVPVCRCDCACLLGGCAATQAGPGVCLTISSPLSTNWGPVGRAMRVAALAGAPDGAALPPGRAAPLARAAARRQRRAGAGDGGRVAGRRRRPLYARQAAAPLDARAPGVRRAARRARPCVPVLRLGEAHSAGLLSRTHNSMHWRRDAAILRERKRTLVPAAGLYIIARSSKVRRGPRFGGSKGTRPPSKD
ncbi:MAG: hypothetical protein J3K34DRAFT_441699 [Monoraphidium minutum]|nr:MAG: hypothetical protein J3K34DRAFT_441699 [Monoraphidium minutum]